MTWNGDAYIRESERTYGQRVQSAGFHLLTRVRENLSNPGTADVKAGYTNSAGRKIRKGSRIYGAIRSKPGEFPRKQYGTLRQRMQQDFDAETLTARVGSTYPIAKFLELGTAKMLPRPFLRRTLGEERQNIVDIITHGGTVDIKVG